MEENVVLVRKAELDVAHRVGGARQLPHLDAGPSRRDRLPVDLGRIELRGVVAVARKDLVAARLQIAEPLLEDVRRDQLPHQLVGDVPIRVDRRIIDRAGEHRGRRRGLADDHLHRIGDPAVFDHPQLRRGGIDHDVALLEGHGAGAIEAGEHPRIGRGAGRLHLLPGRIAQPGVDWIAARYRTDVRAERTGRRCADQDLPRRLLVRGRPAVGEQHPRGRALKRLHVHHPGRGQEAIGLGERGRVAALGAVEQGHGLAGERGPTRQAVERSTLEHADQLARGGAVGPRAKPQGGALARRVEGRDRLRTARGLRGDLGNRRRRSGHSRDQQRRTGDAGQHPDFHVELLLTVLRR